MTANDESRPAAPGWAPLCYIWDGGFLGLGYSRGVVPTHAHHAIQVCLSLEGVVGVRDAGDPGTDGETGGGRRYGGAVVAADHPHGFDGDGELVGMLFVDPESREGRWLRGTYSEAVADIPEHRLEACRERLREAWTEPPDVAGAAQLVSGLVRSLCTGPPPTRGLD